jgi:N-acetylneuraminic acid mutarotase
MSDTWQYNSLTNTWTQKGDFGNGAGANQVYATPRVDASAFAIGNYGYVLCGYDNTGSYKKDSWIYDPGSDHWNLTAVQFNGSSREGAIVLVHNDVAYIVTGDNAGLLAPDMIRFTPSNISAPWSDSLGKIYNASADTKDDDYTDIERSFGSGMVIGDSAYITLGSNVKTWGYDFKNDQWFRKTSFEKTGTQTLRSRAVSFVVGRRGFVTTGATGPGGSGGQAGGTEQGDIVEWQPYVAYNSYD